MAVSRSDLARNRGNPPSKSNDDRSGDIGAIDVEGEMSGESTAAWSMWMSDRVVVDDAFANRVVDDFAEIGWDVGWEVGALVADTLVVVIAAGAGADVADFKKEREVLILNGGCELLPSPLYEEVLWLASDGLCRPKIGCDCEGE